MAAKQAHFLEGKKIIVAGAGIAGLAFVVALQKQWDPSLQAPEIVVYDRDIRDLSIKREGYSLSLNGADKDGGLLAMRQLGLLDEALKCAVPGLDRMGGSFKVWDSDWNDQLTIRLRPHGGLPTSGIRIARKDLRNILIAAAEGATSITWGTSCVVAQRLENGRIRVQLDSEDGSAPRENECDLLIAADGARSKLRASLRPKDQLRPLADHWGILISGQGVCCFASPVDKETVVWALSRLEEKRREVPREQTPEQFQALMREAIDWGGMLAEPFPTLVRKTEAATALCLPAMDKQPFSHQSEELGGVVFIGDSNHAVSPFAGNGANLALKDGWDLAEQLCGSDALGTAVARYDAISHPRALQTLKTSHQRIAMGHATGARYLVVRILFAVGAFMMWLMGK